MRVCNKCAVSQPLTEYWKLPSGRDGINPRCKTCVNTARNEYNRSVAPEVKRNSRYRLIYGIDLDEYERMLAVQGGVCAICDQPEKAKNRLLCVDHDHQTGVVRGLLCTRCNTALGSYELMARNERAMRYLEGSLR